MCRKISLIAPLMLAATAACYAQSTEPEAMCQFITAQGDQLYEGDRQFRFVSFNIPNLHVVEDNYSFLTSNPWRWPDAFEIADALESVRQMGGQVVRIYVLSVRRPGSDMGDHVHVLGPGQFNEQAFEVLDRVLQIAREKGVRVIIPFVDNWHWWGGCAEYARFRGKEAEEFWTDEQIISDFEQTVRYTLNRVNRYTGVAYKDDPAIFGWETGNELDSTPEWTRRIAALVKSIDSNHLVIDGYSLHGVRQESIDDPNIDVITTHHYPSVDSKFVAAILQAKQATRGKKPYFVGEFGFVPTDQFERVLETVIEQDISGALLWSLRFHNRDGGFYWHGEVDSGEVVKAYHWPGFAAGEAYDERAVVSLIRRQAYAIRDQNPPKRRPPAPPKLLLIENPGAISWQGSAGAESYDVQRAAEPSGPWKTVGPGISDADVQYRPIFNDTAGVIDETYYYRVVAQNVAGRSTPSNVVGPVAVQWRTIVDEGADLSRLESHYGDVLSVSMHARKTQEDIHRLRLAPGSSIVYRVDDSINSWRILLFCEGNCPNVTIRCSADGQTFQTGEFERQAAPTAKNDYGYHRPVELTGSFGEPGIMYLQLSADGGQRVSDDEAAASETQNSAVQVSRVEIRHGGAFDNE